MKTVMTLALVSFFGVAANAQNNTAPANPAVTTPAQPVAAPAVVPAAVQQPVVAPAAPVVTIEQLRKKHIDAVAELKKKHIDEVKALRESLKGKPQADIRKAIEAKKAEQKTAFKELEKTNKAEIEQFRKDHPKMMKAAKKPLKV